MQPKRIANCLQYLENDKDDLFQKAAENYALKNTERDWQSIADRNNPAGSKTKALPSERKKIYKKLVSLFILSAALSVGGFLLQQSTNKISSFYKEVNKGEGKLVE